MFLYTHIYSSSSSLTAFKKTITTQHSHVYDLSVIDCPSSQSSLLSPCSDKCNSLKENVAKTEMHEAWQRMSGERFPPGSKVWERFANVQLELKRQRRRTQGPATSEGKYCILLAVKETQPVPEVNTAGVRGQGACDLTCPPLQFQPLEQTCCNAPGLTDTKNAPLQMKVLPAVLPVCTGAAVIVLLQGPVGMLARGCKIATMHAFGLDFPHIYIFTHKATFKSGIANITS